MLSLLSTALVHFDGVDGARDLDITGLLAVVLSLSLPVVIVIAVLVFRLRQQRLQNELIAKFAASGQPVPAELLTPVRPPRSNLSSGLVLVAVGISLVAAFYLTDNDKAWPFALIPLFIGLARLLVWAIEERRRKAER